MISDKKVNLPKNWMVTSIGEITIPVAKINQEEQPERKIYYIDISSIDNVLNKIASAKHFTLSDAPSRARQIVKKGDVLFSMVRPYLRNIAFVTGKYNNEIASTGFAVLRPSPGIESSYLFYSCISNAFVNALSGVQYGVSYPAVKDEQVRNQSINLPPNREQHRIVAKIEELFSEIDKGVESLKIAKAQLQVYRQALLKHAFEGKLTAQWRSNNPDKVVPAEELLRSIEQAREERYQQQLTDWQTAVEKWEFNGKEGKSPSKPRKNKLEDKIDSSPYFLPPGWLWLQLGNSNVHISDGPFGSNLKTEDYVEEGIRLIRLENIGRGFFIGEKKTHITLAKYEYLKKHSLQPSDLVLSSFITDLIRVAEIPSDLKISINKSDCFQIRLFGNTIDVKYLLYGLQINSVYKQLEKFVHGVGRPRINTTQLKNVQIPVCSPEEQQELVKLLNAAMSYINATEKSIEADLNKSDILRQSILKKAFSGQLVPQNPTDEPASELLKRIQAEKADRETATKTTKKTKK